jgi:hypothetical protein
MPDLERHPVGLSALPTPMRRATHRVILDHGGRAEIVTFDWVPAPALGQVFSHDGRRWQIVLERPHARVWVAEPLAHQS